MRPLKLYRRTDERLPLKDRLAGLKARLGRVARKPVETDSQRRVMLGTAIAATIPLPAFAHRRAPLPAPGSEEAKAAFRAACRAFDRQCQPIMAGYPELRRTSLTWWTTRDLGHALERGEITAAECARLYPLASERKLRMDEIAHRVNLGALHALAFADDYAPTA